MLWLKRDIRILYYYAYLAEEIATPNGYTVGLDCGSTMHGTRKDSRGGLRCDFNQFLEFIWAPKETDEERPVVRGILQNGEVFENVAISVLAQRVYDFRDPEGVKLTDQVDSDRLVAGLTGNDKWYQAVRKVGNAIGEAYYAMDLTASSENNRIINQAKAASDLTVDLRFQDMEKYREVSVQRALGSSIQLQFKEGRRSQPAFQTEYWDRIDQQATIKMYQDTIPDVKQRLTDAIKAWRTGSKQARQHWAAFLAVEQGREGCSCGDPDIPL